MKRDPKRPGSAVSLQGFTLLSVFSYAGVKSSNEGGKQPLRGIFLCTYLWRAQTVAILRV